MTAENTHTHASPGAPGAPQPDPASTAPAASPTPTPPPAGGGRKARKRRRLWGFLIDRGTELLAAILTLVAAVLGIWGAKLNNENDDLAAQVDTLEDASGVLREDNASLTEDLADMTASRDSWKTRAEAAEKAPDDTGTSTTDTTEPVVDPADPPGNVTAGAAGIFRQSGSSPITFASGYSIDLDTRDVNWGIENSSSGDLYFYLSGTDPFLGGTNTVAIVDHEATYEECDAQTVLQSSVDKEQIVVGSQFCTRTDEGRWAYVKIIGLDPGRGTITVHVVVYTLETD